MHSWVVRFEIVLRHTAAIAQSLWLGNATDGHATDGALAGTDTWTYDAYYSTCESAKKMADIPNVMFRSALAPRNSGFTTWKP